MKTAPTAFAAPTAAAAIGILLLAGCSNPGASNDVAESDTNTGVPYGASKADYQAAFEELDPILIRMQTSNPQGTLGAAGSEAYAAALEDWSGGKITVELGFANSFVPSSLEWDNAVADGRLDVSFVMPSYERDVFPLYSDLATASVINPFTSTAPLVTSGWQSEIGLSDKYMAEFHENGLHPLLPFHNTYAYTTMFCKEPLTTLDEFAGKMISASGELKSAEVSALGGTPVAMPYTEQYEALQRGVLDCALTSLGAVGASGLEPLTPWGLFDERTAWEQPTTTFAAGKAFWDDLPLVAQQLIFDRLDALIGAEAAAQGERATLIIEELIANGGSGTRLDAEALKAVNAANDQALAALEDIDLYREASARWSKIVVDELEYGDEPFFEWLETGGWEDREYDRLIDRIFTDVLLAHRPGNEATN